MRQICINFILVAGLLLVIAFGWAVALASPVAGAEQAKQAEILAAYTSFKNAQNERDLEKVGAHFVDGPEFLWVSDGQSFWGRAATLKRMGAFQSAAVWRVEPHMESARVVELSHGVAMLNIGLVLVIGSVENPNHLPFLVSILFRRVDEDWRIAALLTTNDKTAR